MPDTAPHPRRLFALRLSGVLRRGFYVVVLSLLVLWGGFAADARADKTTSPRLVITADERAWLAAHPVIRVGIDPHYAPYSFIDAHGELQGVVREFLDYLAPALGIRFEIVSDLDWPQLLTAVAARKIDAVATVTHLPERDAFLTFTETYLNTPLVIVTRQGAPQLRDHRDISGMSLALVQQYALGRKVMDRYPDVRPRFVATPLDGLRAVAAGDVEGFVGVLGVGAYLAAENGIANLRVNAAFDMSGNGQRFGIRKDWPELARLLDRALKTMPAQQRYAASNRWLPLQADEVQRLSEPTWTTRLFPWLLGTIALVLLGHGVTVLWNRQLARELARRERELHASIDRLHGAEAIAHLGHWQYSVATRSLVLSDESFRIFGLEPQEQPVTPERLGERVRRDDRERWNQHLQDLLNSRPGEAPAEMRFRLVAEVDDNRVVEMRADVGYDRSGRADTLFGTVQDVSAQVRAHERIDALNRLYRVLSSVNAAIVRLRDPLALFDETCRIAVASGGFRMAWIGRLDAVTNEIRPAAHAGVGDACLSDLHLRLGETSGDPVAEAIRDGRHAVSNELARDSLETARRAEALGLGYRAYAAFPILTNGRVCGAFSLYADRAGFFDAEELGLLDELVQNLGFALEHFETEQHRETLNRNLVDLLESLREGYISIDRQWTFHYVNRKAGERLGREPRDLVGQSLASVLGEEAFEPLRSACEAVMRDGGSAALEAYYPAGEEWYESRVYATHEGASIFLTNISARKTQEAELTRLHALLAALVEGSTDAIFVKDRTGTYVVCNHALAARLGRTREQVLGADDADLFPQDDAIRFRADDVRVMKSTTTETYEEPVVLGDTRYHFLTTKGPVIIEGRVEGVFGIARDISDRVLAMQALRQSEARFAATFEQAAVGIAIVSPTGDWLRVNQKLCAIVGYSEAELLRLSFQDITHPDDLASDLDYVEQMLNHEIAHYTMEKRYLGKQGETIWIHLTVALVWKENGKPDYFIKVIEDIGARKAVETALHDSESRYRQLFEQNPAPMLVYARGDLNLLAVNDAFVTHYGYTRTEAQALRLTDLYPDAEKRRITEVAAALVGLAYVGEWHHLKKSGEAITIEARSHDLVYEGQSARVAVITDITARKRADDALRDSEARYRTLLELAPFPAVLSRVRDGILLYGNHRAEVQYGISREHGIGLPAARFYEDAEQRERFLAPLQKTGTVNDLEVRMLTATGEPFWALVSASVVEFDGEPAIFTAINDITARKQIEATLREQEAFFRLIAENMGDMVAVLDLEGRRLYNSPSYGPLFDDPEALKGTDSFADIHPEDRERVRTVFRHTVETGTDHRIDFRFVLPDGDVRHMESQGGVIRGAGGAVERVVVVSRDVTGRRKLEDEIRAFTTELETRVRDRTSELASVNKELETFTYSVSHDLKAPLRGIDGYSRLLLEDYAAGLDAEGAKLIHNVREGVRQMSQLIEDLLTYSRMERRSVQLRSFDLTKLVTRVLDTMRADIKAHGMQVTSELPETTVRADPEGLVIVLRNLIDNALKFSCGSHPPTLRISGATDAKSITLKVQDNGIGFDMQFHDRIFEIFQRLQRAEDYPGTGVGLAIVNKAMQRMAGRVWAESIPGKGTTFFLELPR